MQARYTIGMAPVARFEAFVRGMLEGRLGAWLGARLEPVDIARQLSAYIDGHLTLGSATRYAPNAFRIYLSPRALQSFSAFQQALADELAASAVAHAQASGYRFLGRVRVVLLEDPSLPAHRIRFEADVVDRAALTGESAGTTTPLVLGPAIAGGPLPMALVWRDRRIALPTDADAVVTLGRALDNDIILATATVSRHHARLVPRGGVWLVEDLASTHGTSVNGRAVTTGLLRPGDVLALGGEHLTVAAEPS